MLNKDVYKKYADKWQQDIKQALIEKNANASMGASNSLENTVFEKGFTIRGANYFEFIEYGRRAGGMPPISRIDAWLDAKGLTRTKQFNAFSIADKIRRTGSLQYRLGRPRGLFDFLNEAELNNLFNELADTTLINTTSEVIRKWQ